MKTALDEELEFIVRQATKYCKPKMQAFSLGYSDITGWLCTIQEAQFAPAAVGLGNTPTAAFSEAVAELAKRNS